MDSKKFGERIKKLREQVGYNQQKMAELLGVSRPTISNIENGERKVSIDELIKFSKIFDRPIEVLLDSKREVEVILDDTKKKVETKPQIRINVPQKNLEKFKEVLLYILKEVGSKSNIGVTTIYKLFYFIDFNFYEKYEEQLIGATYRKNRYGPTPLEFQEIVNKMIKEKEITRIKSKYFQYPQTKYLPLKRPDLSKFKANEIKVIDDVLNFLSDLNASQISAYSHNDIPWLTTEDQEIIEYESVFYRTSQYSVREYNESIQ